MTWPVSVAGDHRHGTATHSDHTGLRLGHRHHIGRGSRSRYGPPAVPPYPFLTFVVNSGPLRLSRPWAVVRVAGPDGVPDELVEEHVTTLAARAHLRRLASAGDIPVHGDRAAERLYALAARGG